MNLSYFEDFYRAVELSEAGGIMLFLRDGTVLARYPHNDVLVGESYADLPPFKDILAHGMAGTIVMDSPIDGSAPDLGDPRFESISAGGECLGRTGQGAGILATAGLDIFV